MNKYMHEALELAFKALENDEIPIGCVIVKDDIVIGRGYNNREANSDISGHAEMNALKDASQTLGTWKLNDCEMYVTVEPCLMCYGAITQSRIKKVHIGSKQSEIKPYSYRKYITNDTLISEMLIDEAKEVMQSFFQKRR